MTRPDEEPVASPRSSASTGGPEGRDAARLEATDIATLADPDRWSAAAARLLADLGFSLIHSDHPDSPGGAQLLVALRAAPTLRHFDPEALTYWAPVDGRGRIASLDRTSALPVDALVSWGSVRVIDRLGEDNRFLTFGGRLRAVAIDETETVAVHASPGPLVRWSGHSQGLDPLAGEIGAFFGRLMVHVDFQGGVEARLAATPANHLYAAFVRDSHDRLAGAELLREGEPAFARWVGAESTRLETHDPSAWAAGATLIDELGLRR